MELDFFNNRYFKPVVYEGNEDWVLRPSQEIQLVKCDSFVMDGSKIDAYYQNSFCFKDKSKIKLKNTYY